MIQLYFPLKIETWKTFFRVAYLFPIFKKTAPISSSPCPCIAVDQNITYLLDDMFLNDCDGDMQHVVGAVGVVQVCVTLFPQGVLCC